MRFVIKRPDWFLGLILGLALSVGGSFSARSEVRPLEVVGASPIRIGGAGDTVSKEKAIESGLWEGVVRAARVLLAEERAREASAEEPEESASGGLGAEFEVPDEVGDDPLGTLEAQAAEMPDSQEVSLADSESEPGQDPDPFAIPSTDPYASPLRSGFPVFDPAAEALEEEAEAERRAAKIVQDQEDQRIRNALGSDTVSYTKGFRIVEDQGERPVLFSDDPDVATEYVVILEVQVEIDRVRQRLEEAGLLFPVETSELKGLQLEILGLSHYAGYKALLDLLDSEAVAVESVSPRFFAPDRVLVGVEGGWTAAELMDRLQAAAPPNLRVGGQDPPPAAAERLRGEGEPETASQGPSRLRLEVDWAPMALEPEEPGDPD